ncbi:MAG TPA: hypothetical protein VGF32_29590 [Streptosporangiaceae bacterium]
MPPEAGKEPARRCEQFYLESLGHASCRAGDNDTSLALAFDPHR